MSGREEVGGWEGCVCPCVNGWEERGSRKAEWWQMVVYPSVCTGVGSSQLCRSCVKCDAGWRRHHDLSTGGCGCGWFQLFIRQLSNHNVQLHRERRIKSLRCPIKTRN